MLGYGLWKERYGGDRQVIGRSVILNGRSVTVVGVGPPGFEGLSGQARFWLPVPTGATLLGVHFLVDGAQAHWLRVVARMRPGVSPMAMDRLMRSVGRRVEETYPDSDPSVVRGGMAESMASALVNPQARRALVILGAAALLLLLVACANLAGLLATRASDRAREAAVRVALGAGRWRVARGFLAEALLLALAGGALAIGVAAYGVQGLAALWPRQFVDASWNVRAVPVGSVGVDWSVLTFAGAVAVVVGLVFGVAPALAAGKADPARQLNGASIPGKGSRGRLGVRGLLVSGEIALALILLVGAGLLLRSLSALQHVDRGYRPGNLVAFEYSIPRGSPLAHGEAAFIDRYLERLDALPDVESAALACQPPVAGRHCMITEVRRAGAHHWSQGSRPPIGVNYVSDGYFRTLGVPVLSGRTFDTEDQADSRAVVVLSESAVRRLFPEGHPLGKPVAMGTDLTADEGETAEVIGVVGDVLYDRPERGVMPEAYISHRQDEGSSTIIMRTRGEPLGAIPGARAALAQLAPDVPIHRVRTVRDLEASVSADTRVLGILLVTFAALALLLACTGVWAVVALAVARRTREIGLRMALGAEPSRVVGLVVGRGVALAAVGLVIGGLGAWLATRLLRSVLFGVGPSDPIAFTAAAALLFGVACAAAWLPARRATRVQPMDALRAE
jgi:predicted permease